MDGLTTHPSEHDIGFSAEPIASWRAYFYQFLSVRVWGNLPSPWQRAISRKYTRIYSSPYSRYLIKPYAALHYKDPDYLDNFKPPGDKEEFQTFQDFFIREYRKKPETASKTVWPCEGLLCDTFPLTENRISSVKGDCRYVPCIFGIDAAEVPGSYHFSNVFLHNKNYHRIHAPVSGTISRIQHIKGDLVVLRPWIYRQNPSLPAFRNERVNIDIESADGHTWYLSVIGGPAVGSIGLPKKVSVGNSVEKLDELATFYLGSTCCILAPLAPRYHRLNSFVGVGYPY